MDMLIADMSTDGEGTDNRDINYNPSSCMDSHQRSELTRIEVPEVTKKDLLAKFYMEVLHLVHVIIMEGC